MSSSDWPDDPNKVDTKAFDRKYHRDFFDESHLPDPVTWHQHIRGLFTESNVRCMMDKGVNLSSYEYVKKYYKGLIKPRLTATDTRQRMPPGDPWSAYQLALIDKWATQPGDNAYLEGPKPSEKDYDHKIIDAPFRYQYPDKLPDDFIATFYQNVKPLFTTCDQKFGIEDYNVNVFNYNQLRDATKNRGQPKNIIDDIFKDISKEPDPVVYFPHGSPWPQTWKNVLQNWIDNDCKKGEEPIGQESI